MEERAAQHFEKHARAIFEATATASWPAVVPQTPVEAACLFEFTLSYYCGTDSTTVPCTMVFELVILPCNVVSDGLNKWY